MKDNYKSDLNFCLIYLVLFLKGFVKQKKKGKNTQVLY